MYSAYEGDFVDNARSTVSPRPRRAWKPRRWLGLLLTGLLVTGVIGFGLKLRRYRAAYDAVITAGGTVDFHGPDWARRLSPEKPLPYIDEVSAITLQDCQLSAEDTADLIRGLQQFPNLKSLTICGNTIPDDAANSIGQLSERLQALDLSRTEISDHVVQRLSRYGHLRELDLSNTRCTDNGLAVISKLSQLRQLNLDHTTVSDDGLQRLIPLKQLRELNVADTDVTDEGVAALKAALPNAEVYDD